VICINQFEQLKRKAREIPAVREYLDSEQSKIGRQIFRLMVNNRMSHEELSELANIDKQVICRVESGDQEIDLHEYKRIYEILRKYTVRNASKLINEKYGDTLKKLD
jgi:predicted transcriptional regulator